MSPNDSQILDITYNAHITGATLRLRESRILADMLLKELGKEEWKEALFEQNVLQMKSPKSIKRISRLLRARLELLGSGLWEMVRDGGRDLATQACFAGAVKESRLLADFMDVTLREQLQLFAKKLENRMWIDFMQSCRGRDLHMPLWSDSTVAKLRSSVYCMLAEAGYLKDTRSLQIQTVFVDSQLAAYLRSRGESYVLRCLEVTE